MDNYEAQGMIFEIREKFYLLDKWEEVFIEELEDKVELGSDISEDEEEKLNEIYKKVCE